MYIQKQHDVQARRSFIQSIIELLSKSKVKVRSVSFYADKLFITTKYLSVICKQVCGKTAFDIINEFIIEDITELLKYSEKSIKEIANYLEFPNLSYFGKYVKAHTGMSPTNTESIL